MTDTPTTQHYFPLSAILLPVFAIIAILLCLPPLIWHAKNRNIAASALIFWLILLNTNNFLNPLIWPTGDWGNWWMGQGYCDVQIRIMVGAIIGAVPACVLAISRSLAEALDTHHQAVHQDRRDKMKGYVFEAVLCFGLPIFYMVAYYVVQNVRYFIVPVYGCDNRYDGSWVSVVLFFIPPVVMTLFSSYYTSKFPFTPPHPTPPQQQYN
jgi:pheromone a factor receptor